MKDLRGRDRLIVLGVDPGLGETGLVLFECVGVVNSVLEVATFSAYKNGDIIERTENLTTSIEALVDSWVHKHHVNDLLVGIEIPIIRGRAGKVNLDVYRKQVQVLYMIETLLLELPISNVRIVEVNPTESKKVLTGNGAADKDEMVTASPFGLLSLHYPKSTAEALADAYAHGLAAVVLVGLEARVGGNYFVTGNRTLQLVEPNMEESW
jgi:Holliday junction resolvasome RuvABC endonuclease subunit